LSQTNTGIGTKAPKPYGMATFYHAAHRKVKEKILAHYACVGNARASTRFRAPSAKRREKVEFQRFFTRFKSKLHEM